MEKLTAEILADLYRLDPGLKEKEPELERLIVKLIKARPEAELDETFRRELRDRLLAEYRARPADAGVKLSWSSLMKKFFETPRFGYAMGGAALLLLVAAVAVGRLPAGRQAPSVSGPLQIGLTASQQFRNVGDNAFGPLSGAASGPTVAESSAPKGAVSSTVRPLRDESASNLALGSGAAQAPTEPATAPVPAVPLGLGGGGGGVPGKVMIGFAPQMTEYRFKYAGTDLPLPESGKVEVLKRDRSAGSAALTAALGSAALGLVDLGKLRDARIQNLTLTEDRDYGYQININLEDGSISVNQNWSRWPQPYAVQCQPDQPCGPPRLNLSDLPSDSETIGIADDFLAGLGVSTAGYASPVVDNAWRIAYDATPNKADAWVPEQLSVAYQLLINGRKVYSEDGSVMGMMVQVDVRTRRAAGVSQIYLQSYQSSSYAAVTDPAKVLDYAASGGLVPAYAYGIPGAESRTVEVELGAPEQAYMAKWVFKNGLSESLLVPALAFPVKRTAETSSLYRDRIVVPLAEELLAGQGGGPVLYKGSPEAYPVIDLPAAGEVAAPPEVK